MVEGEGSEEQGEYHGRENSRVEQNAKDEGGELSRAPESFNDSHVVERHGGEEDFGRVRVACLDRRVSILSSHGGGQQSVPATREASMLACTARGEVPR